MLKKVALTAPSSPALWILIFGAIRERLSRHHACLSGFAHRGRASARLIPIQEALQWSQVEGKWVVQGAIDVDIGAILLLKVAKMMRALRIKLSKWLTL